MLSNVLDHMDGVRVGEHPKVIRLLKGIFQTNPPKKSLVPEWDLSIVLNALKRPPFEPLSSAPPKFVTLKTTFLLAATTARRVSDLSYLGIGSHCRILQDNVTFLPRRLAKADDPGHFMTPIVVPGYPQDETLCVIRALKTYLSITENRRKGKEPGALLRILVKPFGPASPQTISKWLVQVINMAYDSSNQEQPSRVKAHSVRALAPSWAGKQGASLSQIMQAADWRRAPTFSRFYLRDLSDHQTAFGRAVLSAADI
jgi:hypothetical protein